MAKRLGHNLLTSGGFFMLMIEVKDVSKSIDSKYLFEDVNLSIYEGDKIGLVGKNGSGKTTLINMILGKDVDYTGTIHTHCSMSHMPQLEFSNSSNRSGGEYTKDKFYKAIREQSEMIIADEPTCNLDLESISHLERQLSRIKTCIIVSHDETLLNGVCNKIMVIEHNQVKLVNMDYSTYKSTKADQEAYAKVAYEKYQSEKKRLDHSVKKVEKKARGMKKAPNRMGNSEARLHKREGGERRAKIEGNSKAIETRMNQLTPVEKPFETKSIKIKVLNEYNLHARLLIDVYDLNVQFDEQVIFHQAKFKMENYQKLWLQGKNGSGKSTLLKMICNKDKGIILANKLKIGYFDQKLENLNYERNILENVQETSSRNEQDIRTVLGNLLFRRDDVYKAISNLSGGELVKASFAKILLSDINLLILDEPTNYLDLETKKVMIEALQSYEGAMLFVSHDRGFGESLATCIYEIRNQRIDFIR